MRGSHESPRKHLVVQGVPCTHAQTPIQMASSPTFSHVQSLSNLVVTKTKFATPRLSMEYKGGYLPKSQHSPGKDHKTMLVVN
mmetsp:Transcript_16271/g.37387  ORF Transcript_16271/g.37387 Transcript_16271/m.37387 type:complete len:83 (-) Transcript_16271:380-628(-)